MASGKSKPPVDARRVLAEFTRRFGDISSLVEQQESNEKRTLRFLADLFDQQRALLDDKAKLKVACCSRRAGKSHAAAAYLLRESMLYPDSTSVYVAMSRANAKNIMWRQLKFMARSYDIDVRFHNTDLRVEFPNGSVILMASCVDQADIDRLRGHKFRVVIIDEAGHMRHLDTLLSDVISPALIDLDGTLLLIGTPGPHCLGTFFDAYTKHEKMGYSRHHWTLHDNPHLNSNGRSTMEWLKRRCAQTGMREDSSVYLREWCGKFVKTDEQLVYRWRPENIHHGLPNEFDFSFLAGVDLGYHDESAIAVLAYSRDTPFVYLVETWAKAKLLPDQLAAKIFELNDKYKFQHIAMDTAGYGKSYAVQFKQRYGLPVYAADKRDKAGHIELINNDLEAGRFYLPDEDPILEEWNMLEWDSSFKDVVRGQKDHRSDAVLYAYVKARHWCAVTPDYKPTPGTEEWDAWRMDEHVKQLEREVGTGPKPFWENMEPWQLN